MQWSPSFPIRTHKSRVKPFISMNFQHIARPSTVNINRLPVQYHNTYQERMFNGSFGLYGVTFGILKLIWSIVCHFSMVKPIRYSIGHIFVIMPKWCFDFRVPCRVVHVVPSSYGIELYWNTRYTPTKTRGARHLTYYITSTLYDSYAKRSTIIWITSAEKNKKQARTRLCGSEKMLLQPMYHQNNVGAVIHQSTPQA